MKSNLNRRDFLKLSGGSILGGLMAGLVAKNIINYQTLSDLVPMSAEAPNVLLIVLDTVRAESLSLYGYNRPTSPNLQELSKKGVVFNNAFSNASWTLPSHASMLTARFPHFLSTGWQTPLDDKYPTLAELFTYFGYQSVGFVSNTSYCTTEYGLNRGFQHYEDYRVTAGEMARSSFATKTLLQKTKIEKRFATYNNFGRKSAEQLSSDFLEWVNSNDRQRPFFAFLNFYDAHDPYLPPIEYTRPYSSKRLNGFLEGNPLFMPEPKKVLELQDAYDGAIAYIDHTLGQLFGELEKSGLTKNTLIIITSDHGEHFGEHGLMSHGNSVYTRLIKIPLIFLYGEIIPKGVVIDRPVSLRDIPFTILDLTDLSNIYNFPGNSLRKYWADLPKEKLLFAEVENSGGWNFSIYPDGWVRSIIHQDMHYIQAPDGSEELYNYLNDPQEVDNIVTSSDQLELVKYLRSSLPKFL